MFEPSFSATIEPHPEVYAPTPSSPPTSPKDDDDTAVKADDTYKTRPFPLPPLPPYDPFVTPHVTWSTDPHTPAAAEKKPCCPAPIEAADQAYEPFALLQALGAAFALGAAVGGLLSYSFSRRAVAQLASEVL